MAATAPKISAIGLEPSCPAAPVGAPCAAVCVPEAPPEAPVEAALVTLMVAERVAVEMVLLPFPVETAETKDLAEAVLLPVIVVVERTDWLTDTVDADADALDEADTLDEAEAEAEAVEEMADRLPPLRVIWPE